MSQRQIAGQGVEPFGKMLVDDAVMVRRCCVILVHLKNISDRKEERIISSKCTCKRR
jgi:3-dehydroquinate dehydratase